MPSDRTSADFVEFTIDDLIEELSRRSVTITLSLEVQAEGLISDDATNNRVKFHHDGDPFARVGMCELLLTHIRRNARAMLDGMEESEE